MFHWRQVTNTFFLGGGVLNDNHIDQLCLKVNFFFKSTLLFTKGKNVAQDINIFVSHY